MLRSLIAVVIAVLVGVTAAQSVERISLVLAPDVKAGGGALPLAYQFGLLASWGVAAFAAAYVGLLIGRRWAPVGWLATASMLLLAIVSILGGSAAFLLLPGAIIATGAGGFGAIKLVRATNTPPAAPKKHEYFE